MEREKLEHLEKIKKLKKPWGSRYSKGWYIALSLRALMLIIFYASIVAYVFGKLATFGWLSLAAGIITLIIVSSFFPSYDIKELKELNRPGFDTVEFRGYQNIRNWRFYMSSLISSFYLGTSLMILGMGYGVPIVVYTIVFIMLVAVDVGPRIVYPFEPLWWRFEPPQDYYDLED